MEQVRSQTADEISLKELILKLREWFQYLLKKWQIILLAVILGGILGFTYAQFKKIRYIAECTFVLEDAGGSGSLGQYSGLASMVGIDIGGGGTNGIFQGENILELYKSRLMIEKTLLTPVVFTEKPELLINRYIQINNLGNSWKQQPALADIKFEIPKEKFTIKHDSIVRTIVNDIKENYLKIEKPDKKLSIISVKVTAGDELFAKAFAEKIVENVNSFYVQTKTKRSYDNVQLLQRQADSVRRVLNVSIGGAASAIDANPNANPALQVLRVPSQRRQIDVQASSAIYAEVVKNLEISKITLRKETPLIQVIDKPVLPLEKAKVGKTKGIVLGGGIAGFFIVLFLLVKKLLHDIMETG